MPQLSYSLLSVSRLFSLRDPENKFIFSLKIEVCQIFYVFYVNRWNVSFYFAMKHYNFIFQLIK